MYVEHLSPSNDIFNCIAEISKNASSSLSKLDKKKYAAYFTPKPLSDHMVTVANFNGGKLGDKGAGAGILSASAAARYLLSNNKKPCLVSAYEINPAIKSFLESSYEAVAKQAKELNSVFNYQICGDFLEATQMALSKENSDYDNIIINPPYFKISPKDDFNQLIKAHRGFTLPNIYSAFMFLSLELLKPMGQLTALVPRSFFNGAYHKAFRHYIRKHYSIDSITRYRSRSNVFKDENLLQENVIISFSNQKQVDTIKIYTYDNPESEIENTMELPSEVLLDNHHDIFALPADLKELEAYNYVKNMPNTLKGLGLTLSTGKVVEYRHEDELNNTSSGAMYIEAKCLDTSSPTYKRKHSSRSYGNGLHITNSNSGLLIDAQNVILIKRISSNSDKQRMNCTLLRKADCTSPKIALSNHIQYITGEALNNTAFALKMCEYLSSNHVELMIRAVNGTTQINSSDMDMVRFPQLKIQQ